MVSFKSLKNTVPGYLPREGINLKFNQIDLYQIILLCCIFCFLISFIFLFLFIRYCKLSKLKS